MLVYFIALKRETFTTTSSKLSTFESYIPSLLFFWLLTGIGDANRDTKADSSSQRREYKEAIGNATK